MRPPVPPVGAPGLGAGAAACAQHGAHSRARGGARLWGAQARDLGCPGRARGAREVPAAGFGVPAAGRGATHVFPAQRGLAALAEDVGHRVQPGQQQPLLGGAAPHVHPVPGSGTVCHGMAPPGRQLPRRAPRYSHGVEQVGTAMAALEGLRGHGASHRLRPTSPGPPAPPALLHHCRAARRRGDGHLHGSTAADICPPQDPGGDACHPGDTGAMLTNMGAPWGMSPPQGQHMPGAPRGHTGCPHATARRSSLPWGHHGGMLAAPGPQRGEAHCSGDIIARSSLPWGHHGGMLAVPMPPCDEAHCPGATVG